MSRIIEKVERKARSKSSFVVTLSGGETLEIIEETAAGLAPGMTLDDDGVQALMRRDESARCRLAAWRLLSIRPRSEAELRRALRQRRYLEATVGVVVESLRAKGYLDDESFARQFAEERARRRHGPRLIEQELKQRGVDRNIVRETVSGIADPEREAEDARELLLRWNRRSKPDDPQKRRQAAAAFLMRKGYSGDVVWETVRLVLRPPVDDDDAL